jgi:hypothetical protein
MTVPKLKKIHLELLQDVSVRTIQHRLQNDMDLPSRTATNKALLNAAMKKKRVAFAKKYKD